MKTVFSGVRPTGGLHLGNYLGAIKNWLELQEKYQCVFCIVDYHAITTPFNPKELPQQILEIGATYLAAGIDPEKSVVFIQSHNSDHAELAWILNIITKIPELERMTQFKEKAQEHRNSVNMGLFDYPVLMAADILLYGTDVVPVGEDQKQHVELARMLARRFNQHYGETFKIPEAMVKKEGARIMGLDDPMKKMSKSAASPYNYIALSDSPDIIHEKIKKAVTDSGKEIKYNPEEKPAISNLLMIYSLVSGKPIGNIEKQYQDCQSYVEFKNDTAEAVAEFLAPFQKKYNEFMEKPDYIKNILDKGVEKAQKISQLTLAEAKKKLGLI